MNINPNDSSLSVEEHKDMIKNSNIPLGRLKSMKSSYSSKFHAAACEIIQEQEDKEKKRTDRIQLITLSVVAFTLIVSILSLIKSFG